MQNWNINNDLIPRIGNGITAAARIDTTPDSGVVMLERARSQERVDQQPRGAAWLCGLSTNRWHTCGHHKKCANGERCKAPGY